MKYYRLRKKPKRRFKRRRSEFFKKRIFWNIILILFFLASFSYLLFFSPLFKIKKTEVITEDIYLKKEINFLLRNNLGKNIFLANSSLIEKEVMNKYSQLKKASLKKVFPERLVLTIKKRKPVGNFCYSSKQECYLIDEEGFIFKDEYFSSSSLPFIYSNQIPSYQEMRKIILINKTLRNNLKLAVESFNFLTDRTTVRLKEGWEVYFDLSRDVSLSLTKLKLLFEKEIPQTDQKNLKYIDLRFSKVYYK